MNLRPLAGSSDRQKWSVATDMFRELAHEGVTKTYKQPAGNAIINGKLPYSGGYGSLYYDSDGVPNIVIGILPDGGMSIVIAKEGENVLDVFN